MFDFRIIDTEDGNQIIDRNLKTPYKALTPLQMVEYLEIDNRLAYMDRGNGKQGQRQNVDGKLQGIQYIKWLAYAD